MLFFFKIILTYRLLKLKSFEDDDLFVTMNNLKLELQPLDTINQRIAIHNRKLYFNKNNDLYNLSLDNDNIEIRLKKDKKPEVSYLKRRKVMYLQRNKINDKKIDPFGFNKKKKQNSVNTKKENAPSKKRSVVHKDVSHNSPLISKNNTSPLNNVNENINNFNNVALSNNSIPSTYNNSYPINKNLYNNAPPYSQNNAFTNNNNVINDKDLSQFPKSKEIVEEQEVSDQIDMDLILSKVKTLLNEKKNYLIESDSKIEEEIVKYKKVEVIIHPIDSKYIKLKTNEKDCVTFFKNSFIFAPCVNMDNQVFKLEKEDEIVKKRILDSDENVYKLSRSVKKNYNFNNDFSYKKNIKIPFYNEKFRQEISPIYNKNSDINLLQNNDNENIIENEKNIEIIKQNYYDENLINNSQQNLYKNDNLNYQDTDLSFLNDNLQFENTTQNQQLQKRNKYNDFKNNDISNLNKKPPENKIRNVHSILDPRKNEKKSNININPSLLLPEFTYNAKPSSYTAKEYIPLKKQLINNTSDKNIKENAPYTFKKKVGETFLNKTQIPSKIENSNQSNNIFSKNKLLNPLLSSSNNNKLSTENQIDKSFSTDDFLKKIKSSIDDTELENLLK